MIEYPKFDVTDCRLDAIRNRICARRETPPNGTEHLTIVDICEHQNPQWMRLAALAAVFVALLIWRYGV